MDTISPPASPETGRPFTKDAPSSAQRIVSLDALRAFACFAIVYIHVPIGKDALAPDFFLQMCRWAVPLFFIIAGFFFTRAMEKNSYAFRPAFQKGLRVFQLFLFWAFFYALIPPFIAGAPDGISAAVLGHLRNIARFPHSFLIYGFAYHLWFLSSLAQAFFLVWLCLRFASLRIALALGIALFCVELLGTTYSQSPWGIHSRYIFMYGPYVSTLYVALGALLAKHPLLFQSSKFSWLKLAVTGLLLQMLELWYLTSHGYSFIGVSDLLGLGPFALGICCLALSFPNWGSFGLANVGKYALGVYVIHPYIIEVAKILFGLPDAGHHRFLATSVVFLISLCVTVLLSRLPFMRRFVM